MYQRVFLGKLGERNRGLPDLSPREWAVLLPILVMIVALGVYPAPLLERLEPSLERILAPVAEVRLAESTYGLALGESADQPAAATAALKGDR
jgi:NADH-quinone oxidoreductase subunit M